MAKQQDITGGVFDKVKYLKVATGWVLVELKHGDTDAQSYDGVILAMNDKDEGVEFNINDRVIFNRWNNAMPYHKDKGVWVRIVDIHAIIEEGE